MLGHNQRDGIFLSIARQESEEEDSAMSTLKRGTGEEIETNCRLVRDVIVSQKTKKRNNSKT